MKNKWKICSYGLGRMGKRLGYNLLKWLEVEPNYYCDKNPDVLENYSVAEKKKIKFEDLLRIEEEVLVFVVMGEEYSQNAKQELEQNSHLHVVTWQQLMRDDELIQEYFKIGQLTQYQKINNCEFSMSERKIENPGRVAVYTCITNNYDALNEPLSIEENCDYFFITDKKGEEQISADSVYKIVDIDKVVPQRVASPKDKNRYCKSHGYEIFKDYDYSIYLDGNIQIVKPVLSLLELINAVGVAVHKHPYADDVYEETLCNSLSSRITKEEADSAMKWLWERGMPRFYGMPECSVILCDNKNPLAGKLLDDWFCNYDKGVAKRDQMYMAFTLWKMDVGIDEVGTLPGNWRTNGYFEKVASHTGYQR